MYFPVKIGNGAVFLPHLDLVNAYMYVQSRY